MIDLTKIPSPCYVMDETLLRNNLTVLSNIQQETGVEFILALKSFAMWKSFPIFKEYIACTTASSLYEARLGFEEMGTKAHTYSPAYIDAEFEELMGYSSHITFNSFSQYEHLYPRVEAHQSGISCGIRINPEHSNVETALYNPCAPGSRFGVLANQCPPTLPAGIKGFHCHAHCESNSYDLAQTLNHIQQKFGAYLPHLEWLNLGGGHLITKEGYDIPHLKRILTTFQSTYPNLHLILEPGSAFTWQTGILVSSVIDIVENKGIQTAILDISFTCHMPDCLEMPYKPTVRSATDEITGKPTYRLGGISCLSGDYMGNWSFKKPLQVGDQLVFEDMIHYTTVKSNMFNGISHPAIALWTKENTLQIYKQFEYQDYRDRMS